MSKSTSESGDAINIGNLKKLIDTCASFGDDYDPSNERLTIVSLTSLWTNADTDAKKYNQLVEGTRLPVSERQKLFAQLGKLVTRVMGDLDSTDASATLKARARTLADDIRGMNLDKKPKPDGDPQDELEEVSQSHQSYVNRAKNFRSLIDLLKTIKEYNPKKADLKAEALLDYCVQLETANNGLEPQIVGAKNAGIALNTQLYGPETGLVDTALKCKQYVKGLYGAGDARFKMVNGIKFKNRKEK